MLHLDTSLNISLTDDKGQLVRDEFQNPIKIAVDVVSGRTFKKIVHGIGERDPGKFAAVVESLTQQGCEHFSSETPDFTGFWAPVEATISLPAALLAAGNQKALSDSQAAQQIAELTSIVKSLQADLAKMAANAAPAPAAPTAAAPDLTLLNH